MSVAEDYLRYLGQPGYHQDVQVATTEGNHLISPDGDRYVDLVAGWCVVNAGYGRDAIIDAMAEHSREAAYVKPTYLQERAVDLARTIADITPDPLERSFRTTSGSEAVETAIKAARLFTGKGTIVSRTGSYHGSTYGAMNSGDTDPDRFGPHLPGFTRLDPATGEEDWYTELDRLFAAEDVAAFLTETVLTHQGATVPPDEHYRRVADICEDHDVLLVLDEVANGFGRTGEMFAADRYGIEPDIMAVAKGMSSGYAPIGATVMRPDIGEEMSTTEMSAYSTFGWLPAAVGAASANIDILREEDLSGNAREMGAAVADRAADIPGVRKATGTGLLRGVALDGVDASTVRQRAAAEGVLVGTTNRDDVLLLSPPLNADEEFLMEGLDRLERAIRAVR